MPYDGIIAAGDVVTVRTMKAGTLLVTAFSLATGKQLWRAELPGSQLFSPVGPPSSDREIFVELTREGSKTTIITALHRDTGKVAWSRRVEGELARTDVRILGKLLVAEGRILGRGYVDARFYDLASDAPGTSLETLGPGCVIGDELYLIALSSERQPMLVAASLTSIAAPRIVKQPFELPGQWPPDSLPQVITCGHYKGEMILSIGRAFRAHLAAVDPKTGDVVRHNALTASNDMSPFNQPAEVNTMSGSLHRFTPVILSDGKGPYVALLDLDTLEVVRHGPLLEQNHALFRVGATSYLTFGEIPTLAVIEGNTGELATAIRYRARAESVLEPHHVRDGVLWIADQDSATVDQLHWTALDAATLKVVKAHALTYDDATDKARVLLGTSPASGAADPDGERGADEQ